MGLGLRGEEAEQAKIPRMARMGSHSGEVNVVGSCCALVWVPCACLGICSATLFQLQICIKVLDDYGTHKQKEKRSPWNNPFLLQEERTCE